MLVSIAVMAASYGVSTSTIRRWEREGKLKSAIRTLGGHRRYSISDLLGHHQHPTFQRKTILYCRVSSSDQREDLDRQSARLDEYAKHNGWDGEVISDLGSGLKYEKKGLRKLLQMILKGQVERLVLTHKDRLLRFGSELVFQLCDHFQTEVIIIEDALPASFEAELTADVIELMTVFCARLYGRRSHQNRKKAA